MNNNNNNRQAITFIPPSSIECICDHELPHLDLTGGGMVPSGSTQAHRHRTSIMPYDRFDLDLCALYILFKVVVVVAMRPSSVFLESASLVH